MKLRPFIIDDEIRASFEKLSTYAEDNPFTMDDILDIMNGDGKTAGNIPEHILNLPFGYRVVYSIEEQLQKIKHLSISVDEVGALPNIEAIKQIMLLLDFKEELENRLNKYVDFEVSDIQLASEILKQTGFRENIDFAVTKTPENTLLIRLINHLDSRDEINEEFVKSGIKVSKLILCEENLEEFFTRLIGNDVRFS